MIVRRMNIEDLSRIRQIHEKYFKDEFEFPDFALFPRTQVIENSDGIIITAGGIRPIAESIVITDKGLPTPSKVEGLAQLLATQIMDCHTLQFDSLHAFIQDEKWREILEKSGFKPTKGDALVLVL